jgi:hypothetical protein
MGLEFDVEKLHFVEFIRGVERDRGTVDQVQNWHERSIDEHSVRSC